MCGSWMVSCSSRWACTQVSEVNEERLLKNRCKELEVYFVRKHVEMETPLARWVVSEGYMRKRALLQEQYEVPHSMHDEVPSVVLYFGNFMNSASVPMLESS